jgi:hypothetical protein
MLLRSFSATVIAVAVLSTAMSVGTAAATPGASPVTLTVTGGTLTISAPSSMTNLGSSESSSGDVITGQLGQVQVTDSRGDTSGSGWVASVISTDFTTPTGSSIPADAVSYTAGAITTTGTATYTAHDPANLSALSAAVTATDVASQNTATWTPTISVTIPPEVDSGIYSATITHSVA